MTITYSADTTLPNHRHTTTSADGGTLDSTTVYDSTSTLLAEIKKQAMLQSGASS